MSAADNPILLPDGAPFSCSMMLQVDPPACWQRCEHNATTLIDDDDVARFEAWRGVHRRAPLLLYPRPIVGQVGMCTPHADLLAEVLA